jgi:hypothetical protein
MRYIKLTFSLVFFLVLVRTFLLAQRTILASGDNSSGSESSASYNVGQIVYTTKIVDVCASQGMQQL